MMPQKWMLTPFVFFCALILHAQDASQEKAGKLLDAFSEKAKTYHTLKAGFRFHQMGYDQNISQSYDGTLFLKGDMFKVVLPEIIIYSDGETVWQYLTAVNEVTITEKEDDGSILSDPRRIFTLYQEDFKYRLRETDKNGDKNTAEVDLFPRDIAGSDYSRIRLTLDTSGLALRSVKYFGKDGIHYQIDLRHLTTDTTFSRAFFTFDRDNHPEAEIIDMR